MSYRETKLSVIEAKLDLLLARLEIFQMSFDELTAEVERNTTVTDSVVTLINGLADQIEALKGDPVALQALVDKLRDNTDTAAAAVATHTPQA